MPLLAVDRLRVSFCSRDGTVRAVDDVSFSLEPGETLGLVGESGSGKSVTCLSIMGLVPGPAGRVDGGSVLFEGVDLLRCGPRRLRQLRGRRLAMVFQDPMGALNPCMTIWAQVAEPLLVHQGLGRRAARERAVAALQAVGIVDAARRADAYPHEFSGGMRQRAMIAMALITRPALLVADEPTTALDVTVQAQVLDLLRHAARATGMAMIYVTHDLAVAAHLCDRVAVMYAGRVVETGPTRALFARPRHPYTRALQRSIPALQPKGRGLFTIPGHPPDLARRPAGCAFAPRCPDAVDACRSANPALLPLDGAHACACLRVQKGEIEP
jgi:oligopeptide transport system ATP-binding protein